MLKYTDSLMALMIGNRLILSLITLIALIFNNL